MMRIHPVVFCVMTLWCGRWILTLLKIPSSVLMMVVGYSQMSVCTFQNMHCHNAQDHTISASTLLLTELAPCFYISSAQLPVDKFSVIIHVAFGHDLEPVESSSHPNNIIAHCRFWCSS